MWPGRGRKARGGTWDGRREQRRSSLAQPGSDNGPKSFWAPARV